MSKLYLVCFQRVNMSNITSQPPQGKKLLDRLSDAIRLKHYSDRTDLGFIRTHFA